MATQIFSNVSPLPTYSIEFSTDNLQNDFGLLDTIQPINQNATPTFSSLNLIGSVTSPSLTLTDLVTIGPGPIDQMNFNGLNSASAEVTYASITPNINGNTASNESGQLDFNLVLSGILQPVLSLMGEAFSIMANMPIVSTYSNQSWYQNADYYYPDNGLTTKGSVGLNGNNADMTLASFTNANWLRLGANNSKIGFWTDGNVQINDAPNAFLEVDGFFHCTGITLTGVGCAFLNAITDSQFNTLSPTAGKIAYSTTASTPIIYDGMSNQYLATQSYVNTLLTNRSVANFYANASVIVNFSNNNYVALSTASTVDNSATSITNFSLNTSTGLLTYTGSTTKTFTITWIASFMSSSGLIGDYSFTIGKNGTALANQAQRIANISGVTVIPGCISLALNLSPGDTVQPYVRTNGGSPSTTPLQVSSSYFSILG